MTARERGKALAGDMPWVTEHLTLEEQADLPKQLAAAIREAEQAMKERCAATADGMGHWYGEPGHDRSAQLAAYEISGVIRKLE